MLPFRYADGSPVGWELRVKQKPPTASALGLDAGAPPSAVTMVWINAGGPQLEVLPEPGTVDVPATVCPMLLSAASRVCTCPFRAAGPAALVPFRLIEPLEPRPACCRDNDAFMVLYNRLNLVSWLEDSSWAYAGRAVCVGPFLDDEGLAEVVQWMQFQGHVRPLRPVSCGCGRHAVLLPVASAVPGPDRWYELTPLGLAFLHPGPDGSKPWDILLRARARLGRLTPRYDPSARLLSWGRLAVKQFHGEVGDQEWLVQARERADWSEWFEVPLPPRKGRDPADRLHEAAQHLTQHPEGDWLRFEGEGRGSRVGWALGQPDPTPERVECKACGGTWSTCREAPGKLTTCRHEEPAASARAWN
jgi:hypothetical protein